MSRLDEIKRRRDAALRLPPINDAGDRDPDGWDRASSSPLSREQRTLTMVRYGMGRFVSPEDGRAAWPYASEEDRALLVELFGQGGAA